uniref:Uncharacterized protein n=1 Tax=Daphnia galeata TaxID=27404 RepID=A0A8J2WTP9_9CRUS|nr:unnamed protein product [Daphnia galeata]
MYGITIAPQNNLVSSRAHLSFLGEFGLVPLVHKFRKLKLNSEFVQPKKSTETLG